MLDLLIIGAGPIGLFCSFLAGIKQIKTEVIESLDQVGGQLSALYPEKLIYDFPGKKAIKAKDLIKDLYEQYEEFKNDVKINFNTLLKEIKKNEGYYEVITSTKTFKTKTILFTTGNGGFNPRPLAIEKANEIENLAYNITEVEKYRNKDVLILGGGDSAFDYANMLKGIAKSISLSHRRPDFRALEDSVSKLKEHGNIYTPFIPTTLKTSNNKGTSLILNNVETNEVLELSFDELIVSYGFLPSSLNYESFGIKTIDSFIEVNTHMETSKPNIFACGNCIQYPGKIKTLSCGMGEASIAMHSIESIIYPNKSKLAAYYIPKKQ